MHANENAPISSPEVPRHSPASTFGTLTCLIGIMVVLEAPGQNFAVSPDQVFVGRLAQAGRSQIETVPLFASAPLS